MTDVGRRFERQGVGRLVELDHQAFTVAEMNDYSPRFLPPDGPATAPHFTK